MDTLDRATISALVMTMIDTTSSTIIGYSSFDVAICSCQNSQPDALADQVESVDIKRLPDGSSRGFAFVKFGDKESGNRAAKLC